MERIPNEPQSPELLDDEEEDLEGVWELDPNDPLHPDFDLSESSPYAGWEPRGKPVLLWRGTVLLITALVILGLLLPFLLRIT